MKKNQWLHVAAASAFMGVLLSTSLPAPEGVNVGDEVAHSFSAPIINGMGVTKLSDLKGKPVIVEFWGTR